MFNRTTDAVRQALDGDHNYQAGRDNNVFNHFPPTLPERLPSLLASVVVVLSKQREPDPTEQLAFEITEKIEYNNVVSAKAWLDEYGNYGPIVESIYEQIDAELPGTSAKILRQFKARYIISKTALLTKERASNRDHISDIEVIRKFADSLMLRAFEQVCDEIRSLHDADGMSTQDVEHCSLVLVCHAFIHCKILERPER